MAAAWLVISFDIASMRAFIVSTILKITSIALFVLSVIAAWQLIVMIGRYPSFILPTPREEAVAVVVNGFVRDVLQQLPMEFAVEAQKLISISLEGSVG